VEFISGGSWRRLAHGVNTASARGNVGREARGDAEQDETKAEKWQIIMSLSDSDTEDKVVVDPAELPGRSDRHTATSAVDPSGLVRARGTREQLSVGPAPGPHAARPGGPGDLERDPIEVLRAWPHLMAGGEAGTAARREASALVAKPRVEDKITLAHLALDLYREVEQIQASSRRAVSAPTDGVVCTNRGCDLRINALRGALVEACLLVQRVAMTPTDRADVEDRIRELLTLLEH
jgi:hypothetical protein